MLEREREKRKRKRKRRRRLTTLRCTETGEIARLTAAETTTQDFQPVQARVDLTDPLLVGLGLGTNSLLIFELNESESPHESSEPARPG